MDCCKCLTDQVRLRRCQGLWMAWHAGCPGEQAEVTLAIWPRQLAQAITCATGDRHGHRHSLAVKVIE